MAANSVLLLTAFIWGCAFVAQSTAMDSVGPIMFTGLRFCLAALVVLPFALREGGGALSWRPATGSLPVGQGAILLLAFVFLAGQLTQQFGIMGTSVTNAGFLTALYVLFVPILGIALYRHWPDWVIWPAAVVALAGTWLLGGGLEGLRIGDLLVIVSAVFWALQVVFVGRIVQATGRPISLVFAQSSIGGVLATALALAIEPVSLSGIAAAAPELFVAGALSGGLAFSLQAIGQRYTGAADAAVIFSAEAVFAALAAALLLGERLPLGGWLGCGLILLAILVVQLMPVLKGNKALDPAKG